MSNPVILLLGGDSASLYADIDFQVDIVRPLVEAVAPGYLRWSNIFHTDIRVNDNLLDQLTIQGSMPAWAFLGLLFVEGSDYLAVELSDILKHCTYPYVAMELHKFKITNQFGMRRECPISYFQPIESLIRSDYL